MSFITENQIDGESFLELTESDIKELVKPLGVVKKIIRLVREVRSHAVLLRALYRILSS